MTPPPGPLSAISCPAADELERFVETSQGPSDPSEPSPALAAHLERCDNCRERLRLIRENLGFMEDFLRELGPAAAAPPPPRLPPADLPGYHLIREIARGGQGTVYEATQLETRRRVAVKMIDTGSRSAADASRGRRRIEREAEIAAGLRHPNIVTVYHCAALPDGRYALAMEYLDGVTLDEWARHVDLHAAPDRASQRDAVRTKLQAFASVCDAVQHAHQNGVIHRDLKPGNVLVDSSGVPRVVDFGIARRTSAQTVGGSAAGGAITRVGEFAGTLAYASPEQVSGDPEAVDTRSDVYSLGVILYEMLTGRRPYLTDGSLSGAIASITRLDPAPLRTVEPGAQPAGDELETIVQKALAKDRASRYQTAGLLKADVDNYLAGRAIDAKRESAFYILRKTAARYRVAAAVIAGFLVVLTAFAIAMAWSARRLDRQRGLLADSLASSTIERGRLLGMNGAGARAEQLIWPELLRSGADLDDPGLGFSTPPNATQAAWALFELATRHPSLMRVPAMPGAMTARFEPDGRAITLAAPDGAIERRSVPGGALLHALPGIPGDPPPPDARTYFSTDLRCAILAGDRRFDLLDLVSRSRRPLDDPRLLDTRFTQPADGCSLFATNSVSGSLRLWQVEPFRLVAELASDAFPDSKLAFSRDNQLVAAGIGETARVWNTADGSLVRSWQIPPDLCKQVVRSGINIVQISPDRRTVAVGFSNFILIYPFDQPDATPVRIHAHRGYVNFLAFAADSSRLISSGHERNFRVWNPADGRLLGEFDLATQAVGAPDFTADGSVGAVCESEGAFRVWETSPRTWLHLLREPGNSVHCVRFSPDGSLFAAAASDGAARIWSASDRTLRSATPTGGEALNALAFAPDGQALALAAEDGTISLWPFAASQPPRALFAGPRRPTWISFLPTGGTLAVAAGESVHFYDAATGRPDGQPISHQQRVAEASISPTGRLIATAGTDNLGIIWDLTQRRELRRLIGHTAPVRAVCFSPDGATVATGSDDWSIRLWNVATGRCTLIVRDVKQHVFGLAFHPAGNVLFSCCRDSLVQTWDVRTGRELAALEGHDDLVLSLAISPDGQRLATASGDHSVGLWNLTYYQTHIRGNAPAWRKHPVDTRAAPASAR